MAPDEVDIVIAAFTATLEAGWVEFSAMAVGLKRYFDRLASEITTMAKQ